MSGSRLLVLGTIWVSGMWLLIRLAQLLSTAGINKMLARELVVG